MENNVNRIYQAFLGLLPLQVSAIQATACEPARQELKISGGEEAGPLPP